MNACVKPFGYDVHAAVVGCDVEHDVRVIAGKLEPYTDFQGWWTPLPLAPLPFVPRQ